jgi:hypothetical protein
MNGTRTLQNVAILRVGKGFQGKGCPKSGCEFTADDLDSIIAAYQATKGRLEVPAKLGHDDNQRLLQGDGYPAAGWVSSLRRTGDRLYADLVQVPVRVAELIQAGAYRAVSAELNKDMEINGTTYPLALTGLALLGADLPAVDSLGAISGLYTLRLELQDGCECGCGCDGESELERRMAMSPSRRRAANLGHAAVSREERAERVLGLFPTLSREQVEKTLSQEE